MSTDEAFEHLNASLAKIIDVYAPVIKKKVKNKKHNFINANIISLRRARRKAERKYRKSKSVDDLKIFKDFIGDVSEAVKHSRKDFYQNKLTN